MFGGRRVARRTGTTPGAFPAAKGYKIGWEYRADRPVLPAVDLQGRLDRDSAAAAPVGRPFRRRAAGGVPRRRARGETISASDLAIVAVLIFAWGTMSARWAGRTQPALPLTAWSGGGDDRGDGLGGHGCLPVRRQRVPRPG